MGHDAQIAALWARLELLEEVVDRMRPLVPGARYDAAYQRLRAERERIALEAAGRVNGSSDGGL